MKIGIDIGGSHIGIGLVENNGTIVLKKEIYIKDKTDIENRIERYITENVIEILQAYGVNQIGIAVPGTVTDKKIIKAVNLGIVDYDLGNILDLFDKDNTVLVPDPVYPVYVDTNIMAGRKIVYIDANETNDFLPMPDYSVKADIIYMCSPNNPTGAVYNTEPLTEWVQYALKNNAIILFDSAYESFVSNETLPRRIFESEGAKDCAIEFCSFSKTAGFTGTRCGYTVVPNTIVFDEKHLNKMWLRRQTTKFNGVTYIVQKGAEAVFSEVGHKQIVENINFYKQNAKIIADTLDELNIKYVGGKNSPYIWLKCPNNMKSWDFFDMLLTKIAVVGTPGAGFGRNGEGYFRLTSFNTPEKTKEAMERLKNLLK